jgi:hypothetical protein
MKKLVRVCGIGWAIKILVRVCGIGWAKMNKFLWLGYDQTLYPYLYETGGAVGDVIDASKSPPFQLNTTDYPLVAAMVRLYNWLMVCACETSHQEFRATIQVLQRLYKDGSAQIVEGRLLSCFSECLALAESGGIAISKKHLEQLIKFQEQYALDNESDVIVQWICASAELRYELRSWDYKFKIDVQDMLAKCPASSGYRGVMEKLAKVVDDKKFNLLYKELITEEPLKVVFILYALKSYDKNLGVNDVTVLRMELMSNCKKYVKMSAKKPELLAMLSTESSRTLADVAVLMFFRVSQGYDVQPAE